MDGLRRLNALDAGSAQAELLRCCGSKAWAGAMAAERPFRDLERIFSEAEKIFGDLRREDWLEAFASHPRIGDVNALREKFAAEEQGAVARAPEKILAALAAGNLEYERRFGHIFIVCATGKSAGEMLALLRARMSNDAAAELRLASLEQVKIAKIRLEELISP